VGKELVNDDEKEKEEKIIWFG